MSRNLKNTLKYVKNESNYKNHVIFSLKGERFELKYLKHNFMKINDEAAGLEISKNEHKMKFKYSKRIWSNQKSYVDGLKIQIHKSSVQIDDTVRENGILQRICDNRETEIAALIDTNREI